MNVDFAALLLEISRKQQTLLKTKRLHALIIKSHLINDPFYSTSIVRLYASNNQLDYARRVFDKSPNRSVFLWNAMIRAYAQFQKFDEAFLMFNRMIKSETRPDNFSYACVIRACSENADVDRLRLYHGRVVVSRLGSDSICSSALVTAYSKLGLIEEAGQVFSMVSEPDLIMWNSMILGYNYCGLWIKGLEMFSKMQGQGECPDGYTLVALLSSLACLTLIDIGKGLHGFCVKSGFDRNPHVGSSLVNMYAKTRCMVSAGKVFADLHDLDLVTWSAFITGCSQCGEYEKALSLFRKMNTKGRKGDPILIAIVLAAVAQLANVRPGNEIHGFVLRFGLESNVMVCSALIDMYSKCGFLFSAKYVFENMSERNIVSHNSMILSLGLHGLASKAFEMFEELGKWGLKPDRCTFSALLCACCHAGLVNDGKEIFRRMIFEFSIQPEVEHCVHMVKLLGMDGKLEEAREFVESLPQPVDLGIWGALLSCCDAHGNTEMAEIVAKQLFGTDSEKSAYRVMLSNVYASDGRWNDVNELRDEMMNRGLRKTPGLSWIGSLK